MTLYDYRWRKVRIWWNERIIDGCQLSFKENAVQGVTWKGEGSWKRAVALSALHADFMASSGVSVPVSVFGDVFNSATLERKRKMMTIPITIAFGLVMRKPVAFVVFEGKPQFPLPL
jgi:hypothetical protein